MTSFIGMGRAVKVTFKIIIFLGLVRWIGGSKLLTIEVLRLLNAEIRLLAMQVTLEAYC